MRIRRVKKCICAIYLVLKLVATVPPAQSLYRRTLCMQQKILHLGKFVIARQDEWRVATKERFQDIVSVASVSGVRLISNAGFFRFKSYYKSMGKSLAPA